MSIGAVFPLSKFSQFCRQGTFLCNFAAPSLLCNCNNVANVTTTASSSAVNPNRSISTNLSQPKPPKSVSNNLDDALDSFNRMLKSRSIHSIYSITKLLGSIVKLGHYQTVLSLIKQLHLQGVLVDACILNIGINCYCHLNRVDFAFSLLGNVFKLGYEPTVVTFNTLMKGLFAQDKHSEAKKLLIKLVTEKQIEPDAVTYGTVINGLCKSGNTKIAIEFLRSMETLNFEADKMVKCYSMVIDSLCKDRMIIDAKNLLVEMTKKGFFPNVITYTSLIHGLCNFGQWKEVTELLREMVDRNVSPNVRTFNIVVDAFCKEGMVREAEDVLEVMIQRGEVPTIVTYSALMDGYCLRGQMQEARKVFDSMVNRGLQPNIISYNILINGYCMKRRNRYSILIDGTSKVGSLEIARELFNEVFSKGLQPDAYTYNIMIGGLCRKGLMDEAKELLTKMEENGCFPDGCTYNLIVRGYLKKSESDEAIVLLEKMLASGFSSDASTISMLMDLLPTRGQDPTLLNMIQKVVPRK